MSRRAWRRRPRAAAGAGECRRHRFRPRPEHWASEAPEAAATPACPWWTRMPSISSPAATSLGWQATPHPGEAARPLDARSDIARDRLAAARAARHRAVVVLKGGMWSTGRAALDRGRWAWPVAVRAMCHGRRRRPDRPGRRGREAAAGAAIHAAAADRAAVDGERGLLASDLMPHLRRLVNDGPS